jgi:hypothetical protein
MKLKSIACTLLSALAALTLLAACDDSSEYSVASKDELTKITDNVKDDDTTVFEDKITSAALTTAPPETTAAETTTEPEEVGDGPSADDSYALTDFEKVTFKSRTTEVYIENGISYFPDSAISYNDSDNDIRFIINGTDGKTILAIPYSTGTWNGAYWDSFENNLVKLKIKYDYYYVDATGKDVTAQLTASSGEVRYESFYDSGYYGIKDNNDNIIIEAMYNDIGVNGNYFTFRLNDSNGILNQKGEMILKGLNTSHHNIKILPENAIAGEELYSLADGSLIGEYNNIKAVSDDRFMVSFPGDNNTCNGLIIDSKGKTVFDIVGSSPVSAENCYTVTFKEFTNEKMWYYVTVGSLTGNNYYALISATGKNLTGWRNTSENKPEIYYSDETIIYRNYGTNTTNVYDYTGKKINTFDGEYFGLNDKTLYTKIDGGYKMVATNGTVIGDFSKITYDYAEYESIIVRDMDGMFYGLVVGDELIYPCEYTAISYTDSHQYLELKKGASKTRVTGHSGAKTEVEME